MVTWHPARGVEGSRAGKGAKARAKEGASEDGGMEECPSWNLEWPSWTLEHIGNGSILGVHQSVYFILRELHFHVVILCYSCLMIAPL